MRFKSLILRRYGHFTDFKLEFNHHADEAHDENTRPDFHLLYGPNEAGKSTTLAAITDFLFGIKRITGWGFLHTPQLLEIEGSLRQAQKTVKLHRFKNHITNDKGERLDQFPLDLQGLSRDDYMRRFSFDEQALSEGGEQILSSKGDVGQALFSASAGLSDLKSRTDAAMHSANEFWQPGKKKNIRLINLKEKLSQNKSDLENVSLDSKAWNKLKDHVLEAEKRLDVERSNKLDIKQAKEKIQVQLSAQGIASQLLNLIRQRDDLTCASIAPPFKPGGLDLSTEAATAEQLRLVKDQLNSRRHADLRIKDYQRELSSLIEQTKAHEIEPREKAILNAATQIKQLNTDSSADYEWRQQIATERIVVEQSESKIAALCERLGLSNQEGAVPLLPSESSLIEIEGQLTRHNSLIDQHRLFTEELASIDSDDSRLDQETDVAEFSAIDTSIIMDVIRRMQQDALAQQLINERNRVKDQELKLTELIISLDIKDTSLDSIDLPDTSWIETNLQKLNEAHSDVQAKKLLVDRAGQSLSGIQRDSSNLIQSGAIDPAKLKSCKLSRDTAWQQHLKNLHANASKVESIQSAAEFEQQLLLHDKLNETALHSSEQSAQLQLLQNNALTTQQEMEAAIDHYNHAQQTHDDIAGKILKRCSSFYHSESLSIDLLRERFTLAENIKKSHQLLEFEKRALEELESRSDQEAAQLLELLAPITSGETMAALKNLSLVDLLPQAEKCASSIQQQNAELQVKKQRYDNFQLSVKKLTKKLSNCNVALDEWKAEWLIICRNTLFETLSPSEAREAIPITRQFEMALKEKLRASNTIATLSARITSRENSLAELLDTLKLNSLNDATEQLEAISVKETKFNQLNERLHVVDAEMKKFDLASHSNREAIHSLHETYGTGNDQELLDLLDRTLQHRRLSESCAEKLKNLQEITRKEISEADIEDWIVSDVAALQAELTKLDDRHNSAQSTHDDAMRDWTLADRAIKELGDADVYARLNQERTNLLLQIEEESMATAKARVGQLVLRAAIAKFRQQHQSHLLTEAQESFKTLTCGHYTQLLPSDDGKGNEQLFVVDSSSQPRSVDELSTGTRYQLYLALRAAAYANYARHRTPLPFVADDIMESFDDERAAAAFKVLANMARQGQVLYLTHHRHLIDIATDVLGKDAVQVHEYP